MKNKFTLVTAIVIMIIASSHNAYTQKYKKAEDTVKLNKEYLEVSSKIADLTVKLETAKLELTSYRV